MKKTIVLIAVLFILLSLNNTVFATSNTYSVNELGLDITIPSGYTVITRDTPESAPIFNELGITKSAMIDHFESNNIYLNAISDTDNEEIVVTMQSNSVADFRLLSDTALNAIASQLKEEYIDYGYNVTSYEIYQHSQAKFIKLVFTDTESTIRGIQFYTVHDGKAMNFTLRSYQNDRTFTKWSMQRTTIKTIVDSIVYHNEVSTTKVQGIEETSSFVYTDNDSGITFTVPDNWKQKELNGDRKHLDAKFVSTKESDCVIIFGSTDMWEAMPSSEKNGYNRKDINNSSFTKSDIAEMYGITEDKISVVTYNGVQYYKGEMTKSLDESGFNLSVTTTQLIYINDGWMYMFQFGGTDSHALYSDFEELLNSVSYPSALNSSDNNISNPKSDFKTVFGLCVFVLLIAGATIMAIIYHKKRNSTQNTTTPEITDTSSIDILCPKCGEPLPSDSAFCHLCGAKITEGESEL